ncbi:16S rRNA (cytosine(1407)-C(5))-methyltransferase RsmF [Serratia sp. S1B]|nr:16S rRNA (cytosine(1407)-C(5))-methyltransferase RsmF [Serratia sp. S1B]
MAKPATPFLPAAFLDATRAIMPDHLSMDDFINICQQPLRRSLRVNTLKISVADFQVLVKDYGWQLQPIPWCHEGFWIERMDETLRLGNAAEHLTGLFYIQEASSMLPVSALFTDGSPLQRVLDMAAAPGSKTTQIAALMANQGIIVANEYSASRVKVLHANISRCGVKNVALTHFDGRVFGGAMPESFDAILLDAPCSGEGVVRKDPDAMSNWSEESVASIAQTQRELIESAFHALVPGGVMVYSTCTLNAQENQQVINHLLASYGDAVSIEPLGGLFPGAEKALTAEGFLHVFPQIYDSEGFFVARLRKHHSIAPLSQPNYKVGKFPFTPLAAKDAAPVIQAAQACGLMWDETSRLWGRDNEIWLFPTAVENFIGKVRFSRIGLKLAECFSKGMRWQHEAVIALAGNHNPQSFELDAELAQQWFQGRDIYPPQPPQNNDCILTYQHQPLGLGKRIGRRIKNGLPRELVRDGILDFHQ